MTNPYTGGSSIPAVPSTVPSFRRPSYANVAAGTAPNPLHAFNTLAAVRAASSSGPGPNSSTQQRDRSEGARGAEIASARAMDIDGGGSSGGNRKKAGHGSGQWSGDIGRSLEGFVCSQHAEHPPFFTPSYLIHSRYVQRLKQQWERHVADLLEHAQNNPPIQLPSLSARSSNSNLSKMHSAHVHRGVVQDVVERITPSADDEQVHLLPSRWDDDDKMNGCEIFADGSEVRFNGVIKSTDEAAAVRADHHMPRECGIYYYEVTVLSRGKDGLIGIGFSGKKVNLARLPGWEPDSWAYHGDDGFSFSSTANGKSYGPRFSSQDVIGCGVNFRTGNAWFTKNGHYLGIAFTNISRDKLLFPSVGMKKPGEHLKVNFGKTPFVFDIDGEMDAERKQIFADVGKADVSNLHPPDDQSALVHNLIGQYLAHEGYVETSKAFSSDVQDQKRAVKNGAPQISLDLSDSDEDIHAIHRQKIRRSILDGNIDRALKYMTSYYPRVLEDERNRDIYFRLRCRKFIEMMRRYSELQMSTSPTMTRSIESLASNGDASEPEGVAEIPGTQMELDDQLHREVNALEMHGDDVEMLTSQELPPKSSLMKQNDLLTAAVDYGQSLQVEFGTDPRPQIKKQLNDIFAIMAYTDPKDSVVGQQLDPKGRVKIAEDVNGAILGVSDPPCEQMRSLKLGQLTDTVSLGKPSTAALEKVCAQTEALLDETASRTGGAAAFVNVMSDFLQR